MAGSLRAGVALGGFMGTGKSTVGRLLARALDLPFVDLDDVLAVRAGPIPEQFARDGEVAFRAREAALVAELCDGTPRVIATGGGAWVDADSRARLSARYKTVVLTASLATLRERLGEGEGRPLWQHAPALLALRERAYRDADLVLATDDRSLDEVVQHVLCWLREAR